MQLVDLLLALTLLLATVWVVRRIVKKGLWHVPSKGPAHIPPIPSLILFLLYLPFQFGLVWVWESLFGTGPFELPGILFIPVVAYLLVSFSSPFTSIWKRPGAYPFAKSVKSGIIALLLALPVTFFVEGLLIAIFEQVLGIPRIDQDAVLLLLSYANSPLVFALIATLIAIAIPVLEEILFRGFLQNTLRQFLPATFALPITAVIFTFFHYSPDQGASNWIILPALMILALTLSWVYEKSGNLFSSITLHSLFNTINILTLLLSNEK